MLVFCCKATFSEVKLEDSKGVIIRSKSNDRKYNGQKEKGQTTMIYKTLHRKLHRKYNGQKEKGQTTMIYKTLHRKLCIC